VDWGNPEGAESRVDLGPPPKRLGLEKHKNVEDNRNTVIQHGVALYAPVKWYLEQLAWKVEVAVDAPAKVRKELKEGRSPGLDPNAGTT